MGWQGVGSSGAGTARGADASGGEVKLWNTQKERELVNNKADLFALIKTVEYLERAYVRDFISAKEYETTCLNMIAKFKTLLGTMKEQVPDVQMFMRDFNMDCPAAYNRLIVSGMPATIEHGNCGQSSAAGGKGSEVVVAETVQAFITTMDALKIQMTSMDSLYPLLSDLMQSLNKLAYLPPDFAGKTNVKEWLMRLHQMSASDELTEEQTRQLLFDLESSYNAVLGVLKER
eukprot:CAMPEP_0114238770 /NCGR_PEP_ID=MMETSP0058-20121206/8098_1 /TAXON_ID=36894 /ORGANISM="Pyramimonas parkeae, CCMP726" /LENGTH=231 /DNA_ID=CAMNT_0001350895 /DNA_START=893 /DNA_END=1588 /DNA_ORIENTATION=-